MWCFSWRARAVIWHWLRGHCGDAEGEPGVEAGDESAVECFGLTGGFGANGMADVVAEGILSWWGGVVRWEVGATGKWAAGGGYAGVRAKFGEEACGGELGVYLRAGGAAGAGCGVGCSWLTSSFGA